MAHTADKASSKKPKLVRDSFTIPKSEYAAIDALKTRAIALGTSVKKSELLRAGLMVLQGLNDAAYKAALSAVPTLKTGRPASAVADKPAKADAATKKSPAKPAAAKPAAKSGAEVKTAAKPVVRKPVAGKAPAAGRKPAARKASA